MTVLTDLTPCSLVHIYRRLEGAYYLHHQSENGDSKHLWNVGELLLAYTAHHPWRQSSSANVYILKPHAIKTSSTVILMSTLISPKLQFPFKFVSMLPHMCYIPLPSDSFWCDRCPIHPETCVTFCNNLLFFRWVVVVSAQPSSWKAIFVGDTRLVL
jgi:hypothetical protein